MAAGVFNANRLLHELRELGYTGGVTILKDYLKPYRPPRQPKAVVRFELGPGEQAQVDWGEFAYTDLRGRRRKVYGFVMVLSYSRAMYVEFVEQQDLSTLLRCHLHAFGALGGVPKTILYDNMKTVVLSRQGAKVEYHPRLLDFALLAGYTPRNCRPYRAQTKGRVERVIGYLKQSLWPRRVCELRRQPLRGTLAVCRPVRQRPGRRGDGGDPRRGPGHRPPPAGFATGADRPPARAVCRRAAGWDKPSPTGGGPAGGRP